MSIKTVSSACSLKDQKGIFILIAEIRRMYISFFSWEIVRSLAIGIGHFKNPPQPAVLRLTPFAPPSYIVWRPQCRPSFHSWVGVTPQGLSYVPRVYLYLYSAIYVSCLAYVYHRTTLPLIPDISTILIRSCFRFTDASWLTCLFGPHFSHLRCPSDSYLPLLFLARMSHFYSYDSDLLCSLLSTILCISQPIPGFLTRLLGSLWLVLYMTLSN